MHEESSGYKPLEPGRVDLLDQFERRYWCETLRCSE